MGPQPDLQVQVVWLPPASVGGRKKLVVFDSPVRKREKKKGGDAFIREISFRGLSDAFA